MHAEVADVNQEVRQAKAQVSQAKAIGARTLRMAAGAIERRRAELQEEKEAEKRALRDRVRASTMVTVPAHVAASVEASSKSSTSVLGNPFSVAHSSQRPAPRARALVDGSVEC